MIVKPGSDEWLRKVTASKVAAILGVSPWESQRSIYHKMRDDLPREPAKEWQARGHYLEPAILAWWRDRHNVTPKRGVWRNQPTYTLGRWAAATPDAECVLPDGKVLVEAKSENDDAEWGDPGTDVIPDYYLVQCYWSLHLAYKAAKRKKLAPVETCFVPMIGPRLRFQEYVVHYTPAIGDDLEKRMADFYASLKAKTPPPLDDSLATYNAIRKIHPDIERGETVQLDLADAEHFADAIAGEQISADQARYWRSYVIDAMGRAQYAECRGVRVARRQPNKTGVSFVPVIKSASALTTTPQEISA